MCVISGNTHAMSECWLLLHLHTGQSLLTAPSRLIKHWLETISQRRPVADDVLSCLAEHNYHLQPNVKNWLLGNDKLNVIVIFSAHLHVEASFCCRRSVRPSVLLSVCQTRGSWQNETNLCRHSYTIWKVNSSSLPTRRMVGRDAHLYLKFLAKLTPMLQKWRFPIDIRL